MAKILLVRTPTNRQPFSFQPTTTTIAGITHHIYNAIFNINIPQSTLNNTQELRQAIKVYNWVTVVLVWVMEQCK